MKTPPGLSTRYTSANTRSGCCRYCTLLCVCMWEEGAIGEVNVWDGQHWEGWEQMAEGWKGKVGWGAAASIHSHFLGGLQMPPATLRGVSIRTPPRTQSSQSHAPTCTPTAPRCPRSPHALARAQAPRPPSAPRAGSRFCYN